MRRVLQPLATHLPTPPATATRYYRAVFSPRALALARPETATSEAQLARRWARAWDNQSPINRIARATARSLFDVTTVCLPDLATAALKGFN